MRIRGRGRSDHDDARTVAETELAPKHADEVRARAREIETARQLAERERDRDQRRVEQEARARAQVERDARLVWRAAYGPKIARELRPFEPYWVLRLDRQLWAYSDRGAVLEAAALAEAGRFSRVEIVGERPGPYAHTSSRRLLDSDQGIEGYRLVGRTSELGADPSRGLEAVDPPFDAIRELIAEREAERVRQHAERARADRERRRAEFERGRYGRPVPGEAE
jgi:hypothetical protein